MKKIISQGYYILSYLRPINSPKKIFRAKMQFIYPDELHFSFARKINTIMVDL
jgi:hypothetical protein